MTRRFPKPSRFRPQFGAAMAVSLFLIAAAFVWAGDEKAVVPYPLDTCLVSHEKLGEEGDEPVTLVDGGQEFKFCCKKCIKEFKADPAKIHAALDKEIVKMQKPTYPLTTCVVSKETLDDEAVDYVYQGRLIRFCCRECVKEFKSDPATYLSKIDAAKGKKG